MISAALGASSAKVEWEGIFTLLCRVYFWLSE